MTDRAYLASQSDPDRNRHFRRRWGEEGPQRLPCAIPAALPPDPAPAGPGAALLRDRDAWLAARRAGA